MNKQGQIIRALSGFYTVYDGKESIVCKARGKFRKNGQTPLVGDHCEFSYDGQNEGWITKLYPRHNMLVRPPVANIDQALIVVSAKEPDFSTVLLDRFLALVEHADITPIIIVTKTDLIDEQVLQKMIEPYQVAGYHLILTNPKDKASHKAIQALFKGKLSVFTGQSGVGKSTLLNAIDPALDLKTGVISNVLGRGKHTTRHVELFELYSGWVADTPGFSSLNLDFSERELAVAYHDFKTLSQACKFRGCLHLSEPECAVKQAVKDGHISEERYTHYQMFLDEIRQKKGKF